MKALDEGATSQYCGFEDGGDTYGLGVRLGAYLQWITSLFAYQLSATEASSMTGVNTCSHVAMFAALVRVSIARTPHFYPSEAFVLLLFCICGTCSTFSTSRQFQSAAATAAALKTLLDRICAFSPGGLVRIGLCVAISAYSVWFTFHGLDTVEHPLCSATVLFFAPVSLYHWFRQLLKAAAICGITATAVAFFASLLLVSAESHAWFKNWMEADHDEAENTMTMVFPSWRELSIAVAMLAIFVVAVELTIVWSYVYGVYSCGSTGQIFPLVIGIASVMRLAYIMSRSYVRGDLTFVNASTGWCFKALQGRISSSL